MSGVDVKVERAGVQVQEMRQVPKRPWPHWTAMQANTCHLLGGDGERIVRVVAFERLAPDEPTMMSFEYVPKHRNSHDVLMANVRLPLGETGRDAVIPIGGTVTYRPEYSLTEAVSPPRPTAGEPRDHTAVNICLHTEGQSGEPMITLDQVASAMAKVEAEGPGRFDPAHGEYVLPDGTVREALEVCWESVMGRGYRYPDHPLVDTGDDHRGVTFHLKDFPWYASASSGVQVQPIAGFGTVGPSFRFLTLDPGARLHSGDRATYRFAALLAGQIRREETSLGAPTVLLAGPSHSFDVIAEESSLVWMVEWQGRGTSLAPSWDI